MSFKRENNRIDAKGVTNIDKNTKIKEADVLKNNNKVTEITETKIIFPKSKQKKKNNIPTSVRLNPIAFERLIKQAEESELSINATINLFLDQIYNEDTKNFKIEIEKQEENRNTTCTATIREDISKALKKQAIIRNISVGEYFSKMFLKALK